jgi:DNA-binding response OmpR family regulator
MKHLILYAEDDVHIAALNIKDFQTNGYDVIWVTNGEAAIKRYKEDSPDIVLLDIKMPGLDGYQVAKEIRRKDLVTPVIFLTSFSDTQNAIKGLETGANDYIRKSVETEELLSRIHDTIQRNPVRQNQVIHITPDTSLDMAGQQLKSSGVSCNLSFRDCKLLWLLALNKNIPQKREQVISQVWGGENQRGKTYMNKSISLLRKLMAGDRRIHFTANRGDSIALMVDDFEPSPQAPLI